MKKDDIHDELKGLSPLLDQLKDKGDGMSAPPDYFSRLNERVMQRLEAEGEIRTPEPVRFWSVAVNRTRMAVAAAAAVVLLLTAWWWMRPAETPLVADTGVQEEMTVDSLTQEDAEAYIQENIMEFDAEMLAAEFDEPTSPESTMPTTTKKNTTNTPQEDLDDVLDDLTEEELEDLL
jgi:anti-sigma-K factor RskA